MIARAAELLARRPGAIAVVDEPPGAGFARALESALTAPRVFTHPARALLCGQDLDAEMPITAAWPGAMLTSRVRLRRIDTLYAGDAVGLIALLDSATAPSALDGARATIARCRPAILLAAAADRPDLAEYIWLPAPSGPTLALPRGEDAPALESVPGVAGPVVVAFDADLVCAGLHAPEPGAPDGGRWTGAALDAWFALPRPKAGSWRLELEIGDWGVGAAGFAIRIGAERLIPSGAGEMRPSYGPFVLGPEADPVLRIALFPPSPVADPIRWPRKIGVRIRSATLTPAP